MKARQKEQDEMQARRRAEEEAMRAREQEARRGGRNAEEEEVDHIGGLASGSADEEVLGNEKPAMGADHAESPSDTGLISKITSTMQSVFSWGARNKKKQQAPGAPEATAAEVARE